MRTFSVALVSILCAALVSPASADNDKDKGHGRGNGNKAEHNDNDHRGGVVIVPQQQIVVVPQQQFVIVDRDRDRVRTYYRQEYVAGRCPPGLAKKNNGCMPPGQANRLWVVGQPLPPEIVYYPMPRELWTQLTPPPSGYEYVRVDNDILLISITSRLIAGMLGNLGSFND